MKKTTILFDLDGTLIDSTIAILESFQFAFESFGKKSPQDFQITKLIGHTLEDIFMKLGVDEKLVKQYVDTYKIHYFKISIAKTKFIKNAKKSIIKAHEFANLGVVTTKTGSASKKLLEHFGVLQYFTAVIGREDVLEPKPAPEPIYKAIEMINPTNANIWMIGDTTLDAKAAISANVNIASVLCGYGKESDLREFSDNIFKDTLQAIEYIEAHT